MLTRANGSTRVHRSLTHPGRKLLLGCDRNELFSSLQFTLVLCIAAFYVVGFFGVFLPPIWTYFRIRQLRKLGKNPHYFDVYRRTSREQGIYPQGRLPKAFGFSREEYHLPKQPVHLQALAAVNVARKWIMSQMKERAPGIYRQLAYDNPSHGLPDRIVYKYKRDDRVTINRNGTLVASWRYDCDDQSAQKMFDRAVTTNEPLHTALRTLGPGWSWFSIYDQFEWDQPYLDRIFPTPHAAAVDLERRDLYEHSDNYISEMEFHLCYYPSAADRESKSGMYEKSRYDQDERQEAYEQFVSTCEHLQSALQPVLDMTPLGAELYQHPEGYTLPIDTQLASFRRAIKGVRLPVRAPKQTAKLHDYLAYERLMHRGQYLRVGNMLVKPLTIIDYDDAIKPDVLECLWNVPGNLRVVSRFIFEDKNKVVDEVTLARQQHLQKTDVNPAAQFKGGTQNVMQDRFAEDQVNDAEEAFSQVSKDLTVFGYHTLTILVFQPIDGDDEDEATAKLYKVSNDVIARLSNKGFTIGEEVGQELEAYLGAMPGNNVDNVVMPMLSLRNAVNTIFTSNPWVGETTVTDPEGFYVMANGEKAPAWAVFNAEHHKPFFFSHISGSEGGHGMIFGKTGVGKSGVVGFLANAHTAYTAMLPYGARQILLDKDGSHAEQADMLGGMKITMNGKTEFGMTPFWDLHTDEGFRFCETLCTIMAETRGLAMTDKKMKEALFLSLRELATFDQEKRDFQLLLNMRHMNPDLRDVLRYYGPGHVGGNLFNGNRPIGANASFIVFEIADLVAGAETNRNPLTIPGLMCLFNEIERMMNDTIPTVIFAEEAWLLLKNKLSAEEFNSLYKRIRKFGAAIALIMHDPSDLFKSEFAEDLIKNTSWYLVLPDEKLADEKVKARMKETVGLTPDQCDHLALIAQQDKKAFETGGGRRIGYFVKGKQTRMVSLKLGDVGRNTCAVSSKQVINRELQPFKDEFPGDAPLGGPAWYDQWIRYKAGEHWYRRYHEEILPLYESGEIIQRLEERCGLKQPTHAA